MVDSGDLVPDDLVTKMLTLRLEAFGKKVRLLLYYFIYEKSWILDGFPRTIRQAELLCTKLTNPLDMVINLDIPEDIIMGRIIGNYLITYYLV